MFGMVWHRNMKSNKFHVVLGEFQFFVFLRYDISWNMLNTKEVAGIPQNRVRFFIAGTLRVAKKNEFVWPPQAARFLQPKSQCGAVFFRRTPFKIVEEFSKVFKKLILPSFQATLKSKANNKIKQSRQVPMKPLKLYLDRLPAVKKLAAGYTRNLQQAKEDFQK